MPDSKRANIYPVLQNTVLGWIVAGHGLDFTSKRTSLTTQHSFLLRKDVNFDNQLQKFWAIENGSNNINNTTIEERGCEKHFIEHTARNSSERYMVRFDKYAPV